MPMRLRLFLFLTPLQECIVAHPEDARSGVSRPIIKKVGSSLISALIPPGIDDTS